MNKKNRKIKLFYKYLIFILPIIILSITCTGVILSLTNYWYFRITVEENYRNIVKGSSGEIRLYMDQTLQDLETLSRILTAIKPDAWKQQITLTAFCLEKEKFVSVSLISPDEEIMATTRWEPAEMTPGEKELLQKALNGGTGISGVKFNKEKLPIANMAVPVFAMGRVTSVLWAVVDLKHIWDILEGIKIGQSGNVYIMDLSGRYVAHRKIDKVITAPPSGKPEILKRVRKSGTPVAWMEKREGVRIYCMGSYIPALEWVVVLSQPLPEIYQYLYRNFYWAVFIIGVVCLAAILVGWFGIKRFLLPIEKLHRQTYRISRGNLDDKVSITTNDEIGDLGLAFNKMTESLKETIQREIKTAKDLAHAKNLAVLGITAGKVTHEVGNLLNNLGMAMLAFKGENLSERGQKALEIMEKEASRVRTFIHNFLQFSKMPEFKPSPLFLSQVIQEAIAALGVEVEKRDIEIHLICPPDLPEIKADSRLMYQVFSNLLKNGIQAIGDSGTIYVRGMLEEEYMAIVVEDTGGGISPENMDKIFDPFFTTKGKKGTGLGMAIVKTIITAHRGTIACENRPEGGARFSIRLPLK